MKKFLIIATIYFLILAGSIISGCSGKLRTNQVEGLVTLDGTPLSGANIAFVVQEEGKGNTAYARTDEKGIYHLQTHLGEPNAGTTEGKYIVTISKNVSRPSGKKEQDSEGNIVDELNAVEILPAIYTETTTTPFSVTVVKGKNVFNFELKSNP
ncbi:MAG: hypothetical protein LBC02_01715 [Planctomycetaceae bacterium]|jgi:hypothetical protein|nr:hypothetical protein [Planctomycetaceae bacterium]